MLFNIHIVTGSRLKEYGGGVETWLDYFLYNLLQANVNVSIYYVESSGSNLLNKYKNNSNIKLYSSLVDNSKNKSISFVKKTLSHLKKNVKDGDICVLIGSIIAGALTVPLRMIYKNNIRICIWIRELALNANTKGKKRILYPLFYLEEKINMKLSDRIFTNGYDTFEYYKSKNKKLTDKIFAIPNAVDCKKYTGLNEIMRPDQFKVIYIARLIKERFYGVCQAMTLFYMKYPEYRGKVICEVWGEGDYVPTELPNNIVIKGPAKREIIPDILREANLYLCLFEEATHKTSGGGLSHSLLEAMASGKLCVCTNHPAVTQIINETNGIIVEPYGYEQIVNVLYDIVTSYFNGNYGHYRLISKNAELTAEKYSCETHMQKFYENMHGLGYSLQKSL